MGELLPTMSGAVLGIVVAGIRPSLRPWVGIPLSIVLGLVATTLSYLGDYIRLLSLGDDFYGVFSGSNRPASANFPNGVTYQRNADFTSQALFKVDNTTPVAVSIDPFFVRYTP
jgi:hypothetical protein